MSKRVPCEHDPSERMTYERANGNPYTRCLPCTKRAASMGGRARVAALEAADDTDLELTGGRWVLGPDRIRRWVAVA